ncbi:hypothetical protein F750_2340 [Streptomyces sp. PAMC 26508]|nr:hypothetical protein F750_2340 [Streptomyces sp. PAMC 26508]
MAALTARNIPRSKVSRYGHLRVARAQPPVRQQIESNGPVALDRAVPSPLVINITDSASRTSLSQLTAMDGLIDQSKPAWHPVPSFEKYTLP